MQGIQIIRELFPPNEFFCNRTTKNNIFVRIQLFSAPYFYKFNQIHIKSQINGPTSYWNLHLFPLSWTQTFPAGLLPNTMAQTNVS